MSFIDKYKRVCYTLTMKQIYYRHKLKNLLVINKIVTIHHLELEKSFSNRESHDFWELVYVDAGELHCKTDETDTVLKEGEIVFHKPNELHVHASHNGTAPRLFILSFECKSEAMHFFEGKVLRLEKDLLRYVYMIVDEGKRTFDIPVSDPSIKKMPLSETPPIGGLQLIKNLLEIFLIQLMRNQTQRADADSVFLRKEELDCHLANRIKQILSEHLHTSLSVDELAGMLNYNKSYLFRQFKASTGHTIMSYFTAMKIEEAKRLLRKSNLTVAEISSSLAFETPNYFSKTFKRLTGTRPSDYRKIHTAKPK